MEPKSPSKSKLQNPGFVHNPRFRKFTAITLSILFILGVICGFLVFNQDRSGTHFTVVLDCGSTGSRVNVFEWMVGNRSGGYANLPILLHSYPDNINKSNGCEYHCMQTNPGLHNFVNNFSAVRSSLEPLIRYAELIVPLEKRGSTPIFILGTAGMRRLANEEIESLLKDIASVVEDHGFFLHRKEWIRVLSGKEEAYYGWVALNYKMGMFEVERSSKSATLGLLDLGGSSLQVVAEVRGLRDEEHILKSKIGPAEHDIVAYSLPAFGLNEAFDRTVSMLSRTQPFRKSDSGVFEVAHPCLGSGLVLNYTCRNCFGEKFGMSRNFINRVQENESKLILFGEPNWEQCKAIAKAAATNSTNTEWSRQEYSSDCIGLFSYGGNVKLNLTKNLHGVARYHALSGFFAVYHALNLTQKANLPQMWELSEKICSRSRTETDQKRINIQDCFRVPYLTSLIENALCLGDMEIIFGPGDISWTLGASLIEGEFIWLRDGKPKLLILNLNYKEVIFSPLFTFILLVFFLLIVYFCQIKLPMPQRKLTSVRTSVPSYLYNRQQPD